MPFGSVLACAAILSGCSVSLVALVFRVRMGAPGAKDSPGLRLLDELFANALHSLLVGLAWSAAAMVLAVVDAGRVWAQVGEGLIVAVGVHYLLVMLMCVKRLRSVYRDATR